MLILVSVAEYIKILKYSRNLRGRVEDKHVCSQQVEQAIRWTVYMYYLKNTFILE